MKYKEPPNPKNIDLHSHTTCTDGRHSPEEMWLEANTKGIHLGISDHIDTVLYMKTEQEVLSYYQVIKGLPVFCSVEVSAEPKLQISPEILDRFDYVIASLHYINGQSIFDETFSYSTIDSLMACFIDQLNRFLDLYPFDILGHSTLLPKPLMANTKKFWKTRWMEQLIDVALNHDVALELNARALSPHPEFVKLAVERGARFSIGGDSHRRQSIGKLSYPHSLIDRFQIPDDKVFFPIIKERL